MGTATLRAGGRMGRPIIGITGELEAARWGNWIREAVVSPVSYTRAVDRAGGTPVILPPVPATSVPVLIAGLSGLLLTGGRDVDPSLYDEAAHEQTDLPDHRWGLGVQWNPEEGDDARLFEALVTAASAAAQPASASQPEVSARSKRKRH